MTGNINININKIYLTNYKIYMSQIMKNSNHEDSFTKL